LKKSYLLVYASSIGVKAVLMQNKAVTLTDLRWASVV